MSPPSPFAPHSKPVAGTVLCSCPLVAWLTRQAHFSCFIDRLKQIVVGKEPSANGWHLLKVIVTDTWDGTVPSLVFHTIQTSAQQPMQGTSPSVAPLFLLRRYFSPIEHIQQPAQLCCCRSFASLASSGWQTRELPLAMRCCFMAGTTILLNWNTVLSTRFVRNRPRCPL